MRLEGMLIDIDGTLLVESSDHLSALVAVLAERLGRPVMHAMRGERPVIDGVDVAGYVDAQVVRALMPGPLDPGGMAAVMDAYADRFERGLADRTYGAGRLVPGAAHALDVLAASGLRLGLSTGNAARVARAKLTAHLPAPAGFADEAYSPDRGFGDRATDRRGVAAAGLRALALPAAAVGLVGDTTGDMDAAAAHGITGIGVLTGAASAAELRSAGATHVVASIADVPALLGLATG